MSEKGKVNINKYINCVESTDEDIYYNMLCILREVRKNSILNEKFDDFNIIRARFFNARENKTLLIESIKKICNINGILIT